MSSWKLEILILSGLHLIARQRSDYEEKVFRCSREEAAEQAELAEKAQLHRINEAIHLT
jgi:hypothetical protein